MESNVLEIFTKCVNGKGDCPSCPYNGKESYCRSVLGKDLLTYIETLKDQIEYYEEIVEEYEKAELEKEAIYETFTATDLPGPDTWTMTLDAIPCSDAYSTTTSSSCGCADGLATTTSGCYTDVKEYVYGSVITDFEKKLTTTKPVEKWLLDE